MQDILNQDVKKSNAGKAPSHFSNPLYESFSEMPESVAASPPIGMSEQADRGSGKMSAGFKPTLDDMGKDTQQLVEPDDDEEV